MSDDPQDVAESLDEDVIHDLDDFDGDVAGDAFAGYPPDEPLGTDTTGVTQTEEEFGDSFAERTLREEPEPDNLTTERQPVGQLVDPGVPGLDEEPELVADQFAGEDLGPESAALHLEDEGC
jgi:hypothetical protein